MQDASLIASDLRMCLMEGKRRFDFLSIYRGVQFVSPAELESVLEERAFYQVKAPSGVLLDRDKTAVVLSNGLMDPFIIRVNSYDIQSGRVEVIPMSYAGNLVGNRQEHRVEVNPTLPVDVDLNGDVVMGELVDISLSGAGLHLPMSLAEAEFYQGRTALLTIHLPASDVHIEAEILRFHKIFNHYWLAFKFIGESSSKPSVLRYINRRLGEVRAEVQKMYVAASQG